MSSDYTSGVWAEVFYLSQTHVEYLTFEDLHLDLDFNTNDPWLHLKILDAFPPSLKIKDWKVQNMRHKLIYFAAFPEPSNINAAHSQQGET